jgi:hypothetical protein
MTEATETACDWSNPPGNRSAVILKRENYFGYTNTNEP